MKIRRKAIVKCFVISDKHRGALRGTPGSACPQPNATDLPSCAPKTAAAQLRPRVTTTSAFAASLTTQLSTDAFVAAIEAAAPRITSVHTPVATASTRNPTPQPSSPTPQPIFRPSPAPSAAGGSGAKGAGSSLLFITIGVCAGAILCLLVA